MNVLEAMQNRRSVRAYDPRPIPLETFQRLQLALRIAPSACNFQPWHFILVRDDKLRIEVAKASKGQMWMAKAPLIVVACGLPKNAYKQMGGHKNSVEIDISIALDHLSLVAVSEGLGTCWIGAFDEQKIKQLLHIPEDAIPIALMPVGYPKTTDLNHPVSENDRKNPEEIFTTNTYS